ncbi:hypothetical protein Y1Q_0012386 [Alligator mississippiensis]|uniref:Ig-like domain-containing protein n=1 Tax=Alligator mississippiensis TaxID=8496 RepID=A0A151MVP8_ALLMI|nr:hypothetical protein Y1Q_0012386 [Alligator mississippiensis]
MPLARCWCVPAVPPSWPVCSSEGSREEGGSILLSCAVEEAVPTPIFTWEKDPPDTQPLVTSYAGDGRALLSLHNLTATASGLYRCTAANTLGTRSCALQLQVRAGPRDTLGTAVGVGLTLAMGLVLLALLALGLWLHHQSVREWPEDEDEASYNEIRIDSLSPGRCIASRGPWGSSSSPSRAGRVAKPLWFFSSSTPCATDTHLHGGGSSQLDRAGSWSGSEGGTEDKPQAWLPASRTPRLPHLASLGAAAHPTPLGTGQPLLQPPLGL